jgi:uncharacterized membrane protein
MSTWYYVKNEQKQGPVEASQIQSLLSSGGITNQTLVWKDGMANWVAVNTLSEFSTTGAPPVPTQGQGVPLSDAADIEQNKIMGVLAYLGILVIVPIIAARQSKFAMYHANQGLLLLIASIGVGVVASVIGWIPVVGWMILVVLPFVWLGIFVLMIIGIINAVQGNCKPLPLIGNYTIIK